MHRYDLTLPTPELNLAVDEALLLGEDRTDCLRFWEQASHAVVLGRSSRHEEEVNSELCDELAIPVLRRVSGGASIVTGPGCLMYAVVLDARDRPALLDLNEAHRYVLGRMTEAIRSLDPSVTHAGTSDLAVERDGVLKKFSGNSLRRVRDRLLYHGTLLYDFDLPLVERLLDFAPRQPDYRQDRNHEAFVANLEVQSDDLKQAIANAWRAAPAEVGPAVLAHADQLVTEKYSLTSWNRSR